jgi:hypothetical protein
MQVENKKVDEMYNKSMKLDNKLMMVGTKRKDSTNSLLDLLNEPSTAGLGPR